MRLLKITLVWFAVSYLSLFCNVQHVYAVDFYVSLKGSDKNYGTKDYPFATLEGARDGVKAYKKRSFQSNNITVWIEGGTYYLSRALVLNSDDSGTESSPIIYRSVEGAEVRIVGGRKIENFATVNDNDDLREIDQSIRSKIVYADLKDLKISDYGTIVPKGNLLELFYNDKPMPLARWPNKEFVRIEEVQGKTPIEFHDYHGTKEGVFTYRGERPSRWLDDPDIYLHGYWFWDWSDSYEKVSDIDLTTKTFRTIPPYHRFGYRNNQRYYALNLLSELDSPGEWYLNRESKFLYFYPPDSNSDANIEISTSHHLIDLNNSSWITFQDIVFEVSRSTAIRIKGGEGNKIIRCTIKNTGSWGVEISDGTNHEISSCDINQTGEGGVLVNAGDRKQLKPAGHNIENNHIHNFGRIVRTYRPAISIKGVGNRVAHNHIHDGPHSAIILSGNDHIVEYNDIHDVCFETGDVGAFYSGRDWTARGNVIRYNYFHDIRGPGLHGAMGVYLDDAASGFNIVGNIFKNIDRAIFVGGGRDNLIDNNIFVDSDSAIHVDARGVTWMNKSVTKGGVLHNRLDEMPYKQAVWSKRYPKLRNILNEEPTLPLGNVINRNIIIGGKGITRDKEAVKLISLKNNIVEKKLRTGDSLTANFVFESNVLKLNPEFQQIPFKNIGQY